MEGRKEGRKKRREEEREGGRKGGRAEGRKEGKGKGDYIIFTYEHSWKSAPHHYVEHLVVDVIPLCEDNAYLNLGLETEFRSLIWMSKR